MPLYTTCVLAVGLHGAETWTLLKEDSRRLQAFYMTCQRRILGIRWNDFITNKAVADSTNLPSILSTIAARRHSIFGHIRRLPDNTQAHKALKLVVDSRSGDTPHRDWNRPAGRPRTTILHGWVRSCGWNSGSALSIWPQHHKYSPLLLIYTTLALCYTTRSRRNYHQRSRRTDVKQLDYYKNYFGFGPTVDIDSAKTGCCILSLLSCRNV